MHPQTNKDNPGHQRYDKKSKAIICNPCEAKKHPNWKIPAKLFSRQTTVARTGLWKGSLAVCAIVKSGPKWTLIWVWSVGRWYPPILPSSDRPHRSTHVDVIMLLSSAPLTGDPPPWSTTYVMLCNYVLLCSDPVIVWPQALIDPCLISH